MAPSPTSLLLTDTAVLPSSFVKHFVASQPIVSQETVGFVTQSALCGSKLPLPSSSLDTVLSLAESPGLHSSSFLSELSRLLKPGGTLIIQEPVGRRSPTSEELSKLGSKASSLQTQSALEKSLLYAGFSVTSSIAPVVETGLDINWSGVTSASVGSTQGPLLHPIALAVKKPSWETGKSFSLKKKSAKIASGGPVAVNGINSNTGNIGNTGNVGNIGNIGNNGNNGTTVKLSLDEIDDVVMAPQPSESVQVEGKVSPSTWRIGREEEEDMGDLVDEDDLLTAEDLAPPDAVPAEDCGTSKKACKNCSCGRAEMEAEEESEKVPKKKLTVDQISNPESACGSCGLGDAFRCAGCPYRGLPAFKLGEKISLPGNFLEADV